VTATQAWSELLERAQRELALARAGRWEELEQAARERDALVAELPGPPPPGARHVLAATQRVQDQLVAVLGAARDSAARELALLQRNRGAARGYAAVPARSAAQHVDGAA
jgi:hypothetical protein